MVLRCCDKQWQAISPPVGELLVWSSSNPPSHMTQYKATQKIFLAKYFLKQNTIFTILTWAFSSPRQEPSKSENDRPLVFLNHLAVRKSREETFLLWCGFIILSEGWNEQQNILDVMRWKFWNIGYTIPHHTRTGKSQIVSEYKCCVVVTL